MIPEEIINKIFSADMKELWNWYYTELEGDEETAEMTNTIKHGINLKIPIWYLTNEWYEEHPAVGRVTIQKYGKEDLIAFEEEVEKRAKLMRDYIIEKYSNEESPTEGR